MQTFIAKYSNLHFSIVFLLGRILALLTVSIAFAGAVSPFLAILAIAICGICILSLASKKLKYFANYAFLGAAALWGGVAAAAILDEGDVLSATLAIMLAIFDASSFTSLGCKERKK